MKNLGSQIGDIYSSHTGDFWWVVALSVGTLLAVVGAPHLQRASPRARILVAICGLGALLIGVYITDVPGHEEWRKFMADRALLSGYLTSALLLGVGYLAVDAKAERQRSERAKRLQLRAFRAVHRQWRRAHENANFIMDFAEPVAQPYEFSEAMAASDSEATVWIGVLNTLGDDESGRLVELLADYRSAVSPVIDAGRSEPARLSALAHHLTTAGLALEEIRYLTTEPGKTDVWLLPHWAADPWHTATNASIPGSGATDADRQAIFSVHGTFGEGSDLWRVAETYAQRRLDSSRGALCEPTDPPPDPRTSPTVNYRSHLDWLEDRMLANGDLRALRRERAPKMYTAPSALSGRPQAGVSSSRSRKPRM